MKSCLTNNYKTGKIRNLKADLYKQKPQNTKRFQRGR